MKLHILSLLLFWGPLLSAQIYSEAPLSPPFVQVSSSSAEFVDVDGDNDMDLFFIGITYSGVRVSVLYLNDGQGNYFEKCTTIEGTIGGVSFADVDGDADEDLLVRSTLYINDGLGNFTKVENTPFIDNSTGLFSDIDGDGDQDVLIGWKLYNNDGLGNFIEIQDTPFETLSNGSTAFADIDGDNDQDVLITGLDDSNDRVSKLYINDGSGHFMEVQDTPFEGVYGGAIAFADIDMDGDKDVLITGEANFYDKIAKLYTNNGFGQFTEVQDVPFEDVTSSDLAFTDVNGDNYLDLLIIGQSESTHPITKLYVNDGLGHFTEGQDTPFYGVKSGSIAFADIDGDNDQDVFITGTKSQFVADLSSTMYLNDGLGHFFEVLISPVFQSVEHSSIAFADIDGDNDQDVLITGSTGFNGVAILYTNDGFGNFTEVQNTPFDGVKHGSIAFADVDSDNDPDLLITGKRNSSGFSISKLYINDGFGGFMEAENNPFEGVYRSSIAFADVDGDNDPDLLITGKNDEGFKTSKLYTNDGLGLFIEVQGTSFVEVSEGDIAFADIDGDNDQDLLITGATNQDDDPISRLYTNDGFGHFTEIQNTPFDDVYASAIAFADVNGDNSPDVMITGRNSSGTRLYINDGFGHFTVLENTSFIGIQYGSIAFADVDGDNDLDVLISGESFEFRTELYLNDGQGHFTQVEEPFINVTLGAVAFADVDGDNDQDVLITGLLYTFAKRSTLYLNGGGVCSIDDMNKNIDQDFNLYPNPASSIINVSCDIKENTKVNVCIYDLNGHLLIQQQVQLLKGEQTFPVDLYDLHNGIYFMQVDNGKHKAVQKFMVF